jgi:hypothetical protein
MDALLDTLGAGIDHATAAVITGDAAATGPTKAPAAPVLLRPLYACRPSHLNMLYNVCT